MHRVDVLKSQLNEAQSLKGKSLVVLGACFMDYIAYVPRLPKAGETLHSDSFQKGFGGKGANQAVMAARLGCEVSMVSAVGMDGDGKGYITSLAKEKVDTKLIDRVRGQSTGLAMITVHQKSGGKQYCHLPQRFD